MCMCRSLTGVAHALVRSRFDGFVRHLCLDYRPPSREHTLFRSVIVLSDDAKWMLSTMYDSYRQWWLSIVFLVSFASLWLGCTQRAWRWKNEHSLNFDTAFFDSHSLTFWSCVVFLVVLFLFHNTYIALPLVAPESRSCVLTLVQNPYVSEYYTTLSTVHRMYQLRWMHNNYGYEIRTKTYTLTTEKRSQVTHP